MRGANDESNPFEQGTSAWRTAYLFLLIALGGAYGLLVLAGRLSPNLAVLLSLPAMGVHGPLALPLLAQLASFFAGLAALVLVLARAVREVDTRPYLAIAPVIAVFGGLVHAGLRVDLSGSGLSSSQAAFGALAVALLGGALIMREGAGTRLFGWTLVIAPSALLWALLALARGTVDLEPAERVYLGGLVASALLLGIGAVVARRLSPALLARAAARFDGAPLDFSDQDAFAHVEAPRAAAQLEARYTRRYPAPDVSGAAQGRRRALPLLLLTLSAVALAAYLGVDRLRRGGNAERANGAAVLSAPSGPPVVEQLADADQLKTAALAAPALRRERSEARGSVREQNSEAPRGAKHGAGQVVAAVASAPPHVAGAKRAAAPPAKPARVTREKAARGNTNRRARADTSVALPAWGKEAMRQFASAKPTGRGANVSGKSSEPIASKPVAVSASPAAQSFSSANSSARSTSRATGMTSTSASKPTSSALARPAEPAPKPAAPAPPSKPLTMDQLLNRVEDAAQAQRGKKGLPTGPKSKKDAELDELINSAVHTKHK